MLLSQMVVAVGLIGMALVQPIEGSWCWRRWLDQLVVFGVWRWWWRSLRPRRTS